MATPQTEFVPSYAHRISLTVDRHTHSPAAFHTTKFTDIKRQRDRLSAGVGILDLIGMLTQPMKPACKWVCSCGATLYATHHGEWMNPFYKWSRCPQHAHSTPFAHLPEDEFYPNANPAA